jgi:L-2-hydroxyglutarate oxidase LhgO
MDRIDACVIGAGVVGLAVGRALALRGLETVVLEQADAIGTATSSRNSEVIHAGIYYPSGSLKARLCVAGKHALYDHCASHGVAHRRCGKLIVATSAKQAGELRAIQAQARANGVDDLQWLSGAQARELEPALAAEAALLSPSTGIVDSHGLMLSYLGDLEAHGGALALCSPVLGVDSTAEPGHHRLQVGGADGGMALAARCLVNAAGLWAPGLATRHQGLAGPLPRARYAKGNYYGLAGRAPFSRLVYPVPEPGGLGVHLTLDLAGQGRFGPDVQWIEPDAPEAIDYRVDPTRADGFYAAIRRYWPALPDGALQPAYSGVRPKLAYPGEAATAGHDFVIDGPAQHGLPGLVNLFGIESPGLTASLAIADEVCRRLALD